MKTPANSPKPADAIRALDPADTFIALSSTTRPHKVIDFPRYVDGKPVCQVALVMLTAAEMRQAGSAAAKYITKEYGDTQIGRDDAYENRLSLEILWRSMRLPHDLTRRSDTFVTPDKLEEACSQDELDVLFMAFSIARRELGPIISELTPAEIDAWVEVLGKGASAVPLARMTSGAQRDLVMHLASTLWTSRMDSSSPGEQRASTTQS